MKTLFYKSFFLFFFLLSPIFAHTENLSIFSPESIDILKNYDLSSHESAKPVVELFKNCCKKMGKSIPLFIIPGWSYLNRESQASHLSHGKNSIIISDSSAFSTYDGTQEAVFNHELGHAIINAKYFHLIDGYAYSKAKQVLCGGLLLLVCSSLLNLYSEHTRKNNQTIKNSSKKKTTFSKKAFLLSIPTTIGASLLALKDYAQLNESIADTLAIVKGRSNSLSIANFLNLGRKCALPSEEIATITNNYYKLCLEEYPLLAKFVYSIFPMHPSTSDRINLAKHFENKYPNGIETINEKTVTQLRNDILN